MINLKEIAKIAGVDVSTVSRALNDSDRVKPETKELIRNIAKQYNYVPDDIARGLVGKKTYSIGVIIPEFINTFYAEIIEGLESVLSLEGYSLLFGKSDFSSKNEIKYINLFLRKRVDGIIACATSKECLDNIKKLKRDMPVVLVEPSVPCSDFESISIDNSFGVQKVIEHFVQLGHRKIGFIGDKFVTSERLDSYKIFLRQIGMPVREEYIRIGDERYERGGYLRMQELMELADRPTAVFAVTDNLAIGAIHAVKKSGLEVPDDISIAGFDDIMFSSYIETPLTTVLQPKFEMGKLSAQLLIGRINNSGSKFIQQIVLKPELIVRNTVARIKS